MEVGGVSSLFLKLRLQQRHRITSTNKVARVGLSSASGKLGSGAEPRTCSCLYRRLTVEAVTTDLTKRRQKSSNGWADFLAHPSPMARFEARESSVQWWLPHTWVTITCAIDIITIKQSKVKITRGRVY